VSSTSSSRVRISPGSKFSSFSSTQAFHGPFMREIVLDGRLRSASSSSSRRRRPSGPYQAGIWWPHQSWREMHQGWMFSIQSK
jgi:hypothetical protein